MMGGGDDVARDWEVMGGDTRDCEMTWVDEDVARDCKMMGSVDDVVRDCQSQSQSRGARAPH